MQPAQPFLQSCKSGINRSLFGQHCNEGGIITIVLLCRTLFAYVFLMLVVRLMGKRQIGELQMTEFISAILLSELAALPMTDRDVPLAHGLLPLLVIGSLEVTVAFFCAKSRTFRRLVEGNPVELVRGGAFVQRNLDKTRISREEVLAQIRQSGYRGLEEVDAVILEQTGKMSVLPAASAQTGNSSDDETGGAT
ncbi:MAG: DUF421 domain-containing protein [Clostridiales bacterium]|nr:DUF421 domain-containing protein [Candidatus Coliplasma caballi]